MMQQEHLLLGIAAAAVLAAAAFLVHAPQTGDDVSLPQDTDVQQFASEDAFIAYMEQSPAAGTTSSTASRTERAAEYGGSAGGQDAVEMDAGTPTAESGMETTVQVAGVDEPDFVKTDGNHLYYAGSRWRDAVNTTIISDLPDMAFAENLSARGDLLYQNGTLVVLGDEAVTAYDVTGDSATQQWTRELDHGVRTARMVDGDLVLVLSDRVDRGGPCPIRPAAGITVPCTGIYYPGFAVDVDATYTVMRVDGESGDIGDETAFVGSPSAEVYISGEQVYVAYTRSEPESEVVMDFLLNHASIDAETRDRLETVDGYELSERARQAEIEHVMEQWMADDEDRRETIEAEFEQYVEDRKREIETTTLVALDETLDVTGEETVPGRVTDRTHLHSNGDRFAAITRINPRGFPADTTYDLTVLDQELQSADRNTDIVDERIRAARFAGKRLYISGGDTLTGYDITSGEETVQLEDTGAQYLHPVSEDTLLAVDRLEQEVEEVQQDDRLARVRIGGNITVSLVDTAAATVRDTAVLDDRWSQVSHDMHAFQHDTERQEFFLPAGRSGYVGTYGDGISVTSVNASDASRAFFIGDHLYTVSRSAITAFDADRNRVSTLSIPERHHRPVREPVVE